MAYDLQEQEQLANLKAWWNQYGNLVTWLLILALAGYAAWSGWNYYVRNQAGQAAQLYEELQKGVAAKDNEKVQRAAADITQKYGRTAYASMAALSAAKSAYDANDLKLAKERLQWVAGEGSDDEYKAIAKIRLAGILLDEKSYEDALKALSGKVPQPFESVISDRKGDILAAQNKIEEAKAAYKSALDNTENANPGRQLIQLKLDALGGAPAKAAG